MQIRPISFYKATSFGKERDENQPLSDVLRAIFRENAEPKSRQRILWKLSEVPDFYEASKDASKKELLELADLFEAQKTNILEMALDGDIQTVQKSKSGSPRTDKLLSLREYIKERAQTPAEKRRSLAEFLKSHFVSQVEEDAIAQKFDTKEYPKGMRYLKEKDKSGKVRYAKINDGAAQFKSFISVLANGSPLDDNDLDVVFEEDIESRNGKKIKGFSYISINPKDIEEEYPISFPEVYRALEENYRLPDEVRYNVADLRRIPYFKNLTRSTYPPNLFVFSQLNLATDKLLEKMLKQEVTLDVRNPINGEYVKTPIIDIGKLLYEIKKGLISEKQIDEIVKNHTIAFELCSLYDAAKKRLGGQDVKAIEMERFGKEFGFVAISSSGKRVPECLSAEDNEALTKILNVLDKLPFRKAVLNFEPKK